jgi:putative ABC transport system permease protein
MTLVIVSLLLARSFMRVQAEDPGYPANQLLIARIDRPASPRFFLEARDRLARLPGVVAVGGITDFFIRRAGDQQVTIEGRAITDDQSRLPKLVIDSVTPGYFRAMGIDILEGRDFEDRDLETGAAPVVIVNQALARRSWPGESAVGKRLVSGSSPPADGNWSTVIGVAKDMRREGLETAPILSAFLPRLLRNMDLTIRVTSNPDALIPAVRQELRAMDATLPVPSVMAANARLGERLGSRRFETQALGAFAAIALVLAAAGLYASLAYQVTMRTREIGVRSALGAGRFAITRMFVGQGLRTAVLGGAIGIAGAAAATRVVEGLLYETSALSPATYAVAMALVAIVTLCATWAPARRAARVSPMAALRDG